MGLGTAGGEGGGPRRCASAPVSVRECVSLCLRVLLCVYVRFYLRIFVCVSVPPSTHLGVCTDTCVLVRASAWVCVAASTCVCVYVFV